MSKMHPNLREAASALSIQLPNLEQAAALTAEKLGDARAAVSEYIDNADVSDTENFDIVAFGSIARGEMSQGSDFDWLVIAGTYSKEPDDFTHYRRAAEFARERLGADEPGQSGLFGSVIGASELVNTIGLEEDTNLHHSRRVLLLEESVSLLHRQRHKQLREAVTARYLHDQFNEVGKVPRFLVNDVLRYWRTVAVDYQAKRWQEIEGRKWGLRLLKLRSTRKLTCAGTVAALLHPALVGEAPTVGRLLESWGAPPIARLAAWHSLLTGDGLAALSEVLQLADDFMGWFAREDMRRMAGSVRHPREADSGSDLHRAYQATHQLDDALKRMFLSNDSLVSDPSMSVGDITTRYMLF